jgi:hypothetical protein
MTQTDMDVEPAAAGEVDLLQDKNKPVSTTIFGGGRRPAGTEGAYSPLALILSAADSKLETEAFWITVVDGRGKALLDLGPFEDEDAVAIWRSLAASSGLPLVMADTDGALHLPFRQIGRLHLGPIRMRRRFAVLSGRRPRFLVKRKTARLPRRPLVYREREIVVGGAQ